MSPPTALERELSEPTEAKNPLPVPFLLLVLGVAIFGIFYTLQNTGSLALNGGDWRSEQDLSASIDGEKLFKARCSACHQTTGLGIPKVFPPLAESKWVNGSPERFAAILVRGLGGEIEVQGVTYKGQMPSFRQLPPAELAAIMTYVRQNFGNQSSAVTTATVEEIAELLKDQKKPWEGQDALLQQFPD